MSMKVRFLMDKKFSTDGINIIKGKKGEVYKLDDEMAKSFLSAGFAKNPLNPFNPSKNLNPDLENKAIGDTEENKSNEENKEENLKEKLKTMKRVDLIKFAKKNYNLVLENDLTNKKIIKKILEEKDKNK